MIKREVTRTVRGKRTVDGAGVRLTRVLSGGDVYDFDPFLMLDSFDSADPADYVAGFPTHPHRGIETITYLIDGRIEHEDSLGNGGTILPGESQWMTAGSGILHQEMPKPSKRMLGFQLWLNLPRAEKIADPAYLAITNEMIPTVQAEGAEVRVISGAFDGAQGVRPKHIPATILDIALAPGARLHVPTAADETAFCFAILGGANACGTELSEKTAALFGAGDYVELEAPARESARVILCAGRPLGESIAWGGPIVMNTEAELRLAFDELRRGVFIKSH